jgi:hypothetical protein
MITGTQQPSTEARELFEQALTEWDNTKESNQDEKLRRDIASLLSTAIQKADAPFPRAHSLLSIFLCDLGQEREAAIEAELALNEDPNEFRAQLVKIDIAWKGTKIKKLGIGDFLQQEKSFEAALLASAMKGVFSVLAAASAIATQAVLNTEFDRLVKIFRYICSTNTDAEEFSFMAQRLIDIGDMLIKIPMSTRPNLYLEVVNAPIDLLQYSDDKQAAFIKKLVAIANGRSNMFIQILSDRKDPFKKLKLW